MNWFKENWKKGLVLIAGIALLLLGILTSIFALSTYKFAIVLKWQFYTLILVPTVVGFTVLVKNVNFVFLSRKILNFFKDNRPDLQNRWWHRLAKVFIYGWTLIIFLGFIGTFVGTYPWEKINYYYSFEQSYLNIETFEAKCLFSEDSYVTISNCGDINYIRDFLDKYFKSLGNFSGLTELRIKGFTDQQIIRFMRDDEKLSDVRVKRVQSIDYLYFLLLPSALFFAALWFVILRNIIYKIILYIALGK